ncbi:MAG: FecR domain-containing protein [Myxococcales bacterium]|nr:FecR domain-containing protein [Myxococcales bacterium]
MTTPSTETLWAYAKGELDASEAAQVKAQLDASAAAREALADVEASLSVLSLLPPAPPMPDAMARRIGAVLAEKADEAAARSFGAWWKALLSPRFLVGAAVACALAFVVFQVLEAPSTPGAGGGVGPVANTLPPVLPTLNPVPALPAMPVKATVASARNAKSGSGALQKSQTLETGARVSTETGGSLWLQLPDGTKAGLTGATDVQLAKLDEKALTLDLAHGSLAMVVPHREDRLLTVRAGDVEVKDLGTRFLVSREVARVVVAVEEGSVEVKTPTSTRVVTAGHAVAWHDQELDSLTWPSNMPSTPPLPTGVTAPVQKSAPTPSLSAAPSQQPPTPVDDVDVEPASPSPEDEWGLPPSGLADAPVTPPPPAPPIDAPPDTVVTVQPGAPPPPPTSRRNRRGSGFSLKVIEENLRELERQAHVPFAPIGSSAREQQARGVARLADVGNCELALLEAEKWLNAPAGDVHEEAPLKRMVLQQKVRCLNHLGRSAEALEAQKQLVPY